jgi:hypothetical protein
LIVVLSADDCCASDDCCAWHVIVSWRLFLYYFVVAVEAVQGWSSKMSHWTIRWTIGCLKKPIGCVTIVCFDHWSYFKSKLARPLLLAYGCRGDKDHWLPHWTLVEETNLVDCHIKCEAMWAQEQKSASVDLSSSVAVEQNCRA